MMRPSHTPAPCPASRPPPPPSDFPPSDFPPSDFPNVREVDAVGEVEWLEQEMPGRCPGDAGDAREMREMRELLEREIRRVAAFLPGDTIAGSGVALPSHSVSFRAASGDKVGQGEQEQGGGEKGDGLAAPTLATPMRKVADRVAKRSPVMRSPVMRSPVMRSPVLRAELLQRIDLELLQDDPALTAEPQISNLCSELEEIRRKITVGHPMPLEEATREQAAEEASPIPSLLNAPRVLVGALLEPLAGIWQLRPA